MLANWNYLKYVISHKFWVIVAGIKYVKVPLYQLLIHDLSKFSKAEWKPYVQRFYTKNWQAEDFKRAWHHHWHANPHHHEYWLTAKGSALEMPERYVREMVCDWMSVGKTKTGRWSEVHEWYADNKSNQKLHANTRKRVEELLKEIDLND